MENIKLRDIEAQGPGSVLEELSRRGAQQMLAQAMEAEVALFIDKHADRVDENGHRKVVPVLYLKDVSTGDFSESLKAILGDGAPGLSANSVVRLKAVWEQDYQEWARRDVCGKRYVLLLDGRAACERTAG